MKGFLREDHLLSLCGLNCGLCPMRLYGHCGGCGNGNQSCAIARCSMEHGAPAYCYQCARYPCERHRTPEEYDSFITHQNRLRDLEKARRIGAAAYDREQMEKVRLLEYLLERYNDGRRKTLYCVAVNLLELVDLQAALSSVEGDPAFPALSRAQQCARVSDALQDTAARLGVRLTLRRKRT